MDNSPIQSKDWNPFAAASNALGKFMGGQQAHMLTMQQIAYNHGLHAQNMQAQHEQSLEAETHKTNEGIRMAREQARLQRAGRKQTFEQSKEAAVHAAGLIGKRAGRVNLGANGEVAVELGQQKEPAAPTAAPKVAKAPAIKPAPASKPVPVKKTAAKKTTVKKAPKAK